MQSVVHDLSGPQWVCLGLVVIFLATLICVRIRGIIGRNYRLHIKDPDLKADADELVVLIPGFTGGPSRRLAKAVREVRPTADILNISYTPSAFSNRDPCKIAEDIESEIDTRHSEKRYKRITLVGYSLGALLARKAYVYGWGCIADAPCAATTISVSRQPKDWVKCCRRFVLLAGMNRGWNPSYKKTQTPMWRRVVFAVALWLAKLTHTGLLVRSVIRGEPFVANLRLQWLEVMRNLDASGTLRPRVIQLLGDKDDVVTSEDSRDVTVSRDFIWVTVNNTGHFELCKLGDTGTALERKRKIRLALGDDEALDQLKRMSPVVISELDRSVNVVVFVLHGIRDMGEWTSNLDQPLRTAYEAASDGKLKVIVRRPSYGFFPMLPFLLWRDRQKHVRWFMDQVTEITARFPNMEEIHFIGHSNGTYILASALEKYQTLKVKRVVLAGSVIRRDFPWNKFEGRVAEVRNYVGSADMVVGIFPCLFEKPFFRIFNPDIGSAGFNGFVDPNVIDWQTKFVKGGHSGALVPENIPSIVDFIVHGKKTEIGDVCTSKHPPFLQIISNACWALWLLIVILLIGIGWELPWWLMHLFGLQPLSQPWMYGIRIVYVLLIWLLLLTI